MSNTHKDYISGEFPFNVNGVKHFHHLSCYLIIAYIKSPGYCLSYYQGCTVHPSELVIRYSSYHSHLPSTSSLCFLLFSLLCGLLQSVCVHSIHVDVNVNTQTLTKTATFSALVIDRFIPPLPYSLDI